MMYNLYVPVYICILALVHLTKEEKMNFGNGPIPG